MLNTLLDHLGYNHSTFGSLLFQKQRQIYLTCVNFDNSQKFTALSRPRQQEVKNGAGHPYHAPDNSDMDYRFVAGIFQFHL